MPELISPLEFAEDAVMPDEGEVEVDGDLDTVRELVLRAHPDVVPELVTGESIAEMMASVETARDAYARLADAWTDARPHPVTVPAGGGEALPVDPAMLPPAEKIRRGLQATTRRLVQKG